MGRRPKPKFDEFLESTPINFRDNRDFVFETAETTATLFGSATHLYIYEHDDVPCPLDVFRSLARVYNPHSHIPQHSSFKLQDPGVGRRGAQGR